MEDLNLTYMGAMLKSARNEANLKQDVLSERVGITTRYLMAIENEGKCPALDVWFRLIRSLHISADDIVYLEKAADKAQNEQLLYMILSLNSRDKKNCAGPHAIHVRQPVSRSHLLFGRWFFVFFCS